MMPRLTHFKALLLRVLGLCACTLLPTLVTASPVSSASPEYCAANGDCLTISQSTFDQLQAFAVARAVSEPWYTGGYWFNEYVHFSNDPLGGFGDGNDNSFQIVGQIADGVVALDVIATPIRFDSITIDNCQTSVWTAASTIQTPGRICYKDGPYTQGFSFDASFREQTQEIPEPATLAVVSAGMAALGWSRRRQGKVVVRASSGSRRT